MEFFPAPFMKNKHLEHAYKLKVALILQKTNKSKYFFEHERKFSLQLKLSKKREIFNTGNFKRNAKNNWCIKQTVHFF